MTETVLARYLASLAQTMERDYAVPRETLFREAGVSFADGADRIPEQDAEALWAAADRLACDGLLGIRAGKSVRYGTYATLGHMLVTSETVGEALREACDYALYVGAAGRFELREEGDECRLTYTPVRPDWRAAEVRSEAVLLPFARFARWASPGVAPIRVELMRQAPVNAAAFEEAFEAPVIFSAGEHAMVWPLEAMARPMNDANPALHAMLKQHVEAEMPTHDSAAALTRAYIARKLDAEVPTGLTAGEAAAALSVSLRTFQRELAGEGASFRDLLSAVRREKARFLLLADGLSVQDTAARLGYSEPAAFVRAFRKWYGRAPAEYARNQ
ncbi:AraC family transcriptional regulator [Kordiimonas gwangyangensis]|uniref:AraC family transcriptional regulator n=1 Tax=Kordiimonas gwangyangensis TaxID=288022 RepID=UPI00035E59B0|nr:AraC family transcriptional regulator [Kordiimonas gwangyangensis]